MAERAIQNIKLRLHRYFSEKNDLRWIDAVPKVIDAINHSKCRVTGMRPVDVNMHNWQPLWKKLYSHNFIKEKPDSDRYKPGTHVRIEKFKRRFDRGFHPSYTDEIFTVKRVRAGSPDTYKIVDREGSPIFGTFYTKNFSKTKDYHETTHRIAKVHKERKVRGKRQFLVSFVGHDANRKTWIGEDDLVN